MICNGFPQTLTNLTAMLNDSGCEISGTWHQVEHLHCSVLLLLTQEEEGHLGVPLPDTVLASYVGNLSGPLWSGADCGGRGIDHTLEYLQDNQG